MQEKKCKDCVYYVRHYVKSNGQYEPILEGHCLNPKPSGHFRKTDKACEGYQEKDLQKEKAEQLKSATEWLGFIEKHLNEISQILKDSE